MFTAVIAALGGLLFGYDTGIIASALLFIKTDFDLSSFEQGMVVSAVPIGAVFGAALAGQLADTYGRRRMILLAAALFIAGSIVSALAPGATVLIVARVFIGFAIGLASATCPVYISEVAPANVRGRLVTLFQLAVTVGILVAYVVGLALEPSESWEWMLALGAVPAFLLGAGILAMPQSPRWLVMIGDSIQARKELLKLREDVDGVDDEQATTRVGDRAISIAGLRLRYWQASARTLTERFEARPGIGDIRLLLAHRPDAAKWLAPDTRVDLVVSGHTHGGQLQLPLVGPLTTASNVPRDVAAGGLHSLGGRRIYVSRGIGVERGQAPRLRFGAPPEVSILTLR